MTAAGPLIVEEASGSPPYPYDEEKTFFFSELYNKTENELVNGLTTDSNNTYFWLVMGASIARKRGASFVLIVADLIIGRAKPKLYC